MTSGSTATAFHDVDLRPLLPSPVASQGLRPLCLPFTLTAAHEALHGPGTVLSPEPLWWSCHHKGQTVPTGISLPHAREALAQVGQPPAADWPYNPALRWGTEDPPAACGQPPWATAASQDLTVAHDGLEADIERALARTRPVVLVVEVTKEFENPQQDGTISNPPLRLAPGDYHAVLIVGAATDPALGRRFPDPKQLGPWLGSRRLRVANPRVPGRLRRRPGSSPQLTEVTRH